MTNVNYEKMETAVALHKAECSYPLLEAPESIDALLASLRNLDFLRKLDPDTLYEYCTVLNGYLNFLLDKEFTLKAKIQFCQTNLDLIIGRELKHSTGFTFDEKVSDIKANHEVASNFVKEHAILNITLLSTKALTENLRPMIDSLRQMAWARKRRDKE